MSLEVPPGLLGLSGGFNTGNGGSTFCCGRSMVGRVTFGVLKRDVKNSPTPLNRSEIKDIT